MADPK
jgi:Leucine-rich repeat (LRR) protein